MSQPLEAARRYLALGLAVTPTRGKKPVLEGWQTRRLIEVELPKHFTADINVGVVNGVMSGGRVDVDLDAPEALSVADAFLPTTGCIFGRLSKRRSHRVYIADPLPATAQFKDTDNAMLVELRSTGTQTIWPPSEHPTGEIITFDSQAEPAVLSGPILRAALARVAAAALLARHWPRVNGSRHDIALAVAAFLLRNGIDVGVVKAIIASAATVAGDPEVSDRIEAVLTTAKKIAAGSPTKGGKTLAELLNSKIVTKLAQWLGLRAADQADAWDRPVPFHVHTLPGFPLDAPPTWLSDYAAAEAQATQTPTDLAGMVSIAVCATACAGKVEVVVQPEWKEPVNLYVVVVQEPGTRKSSVMSHLIAPLEAFEAELLAEAKPRIVEAQTRWKIAEQALERARQEAAKVPPAKRTEAVNAAVRLARELDAIRVPEPPRLLADDCSPEKLATLMRDNGGRIAVMSPEGDLFDMMGGRYSATSTPNLGVYLKAHAGDAIRVDRVHRGSEFIRSPALTLGLAVQPDVLRGLASRPGFRGRGLLGRLLYALPRNLLGSRDTDPPAVQPTLRAAYQAKVRQLLIMNADTDENGDPRPHVLRLDPGARHLLRDFQRRLEARLGEFGDLGHITDWAGKLAGAVVRIAGVMHMAEHATETMLRTKSIEATTIERAVRLADYLVEHAKAAFSEMGADPAVADARHVLAWIRRMNVETFTKRDAFQGTKGRFKRVAALEPALQVLLEHGYIRERLGDERPGPGRKPSPTFDVNPLLPSDSENTGNSEKDGPGPTQQPWAVSDAGGGEDGFEEKVLHSSPVGEAGVPAASQNSHNSQNSGDGGDEEECEWTA